MAKKEELKVSVEKEYIIPLRERMRHVPSYKRTPKAVKTIKEFLVRHMKIRDGDLNKIKIDKFMNEVLWFRGIKNPPHKVKVKASMQGDFVRVELVELPTKLKFKKEREMKAEAFAKEAIEKKKGFMEKAKEQIKGDTQDKTKTKDPQKEQTEEEKKEEKEKAKASEESMAESEKAAAKSAKHESKVKSPKQQKNDRVGYNKSSRGH